MLEVGFYDSAFDRWPYAEDYDLLVRLARIARVMMIPDYVGVYTMSASSMSRKNSISRLVGLCLAKKRAFALAKNPKNARLILWSIFRSIGIDLASRITNDTMYNYSLNVRTWRSGHEPE